MKGRTTLNLLVIAGLLGVLVWFVECYLPSSETPSDPRGRLMGDLAGDATSLVLKRGELSVRMRRGESAWFLEYPVAARADSAVIDRILDTIEELPLSETITLQQMRTRGLAFADYGLGEPRARLVVKDRRGQHELLIGADAPAGDDVYVRRSGDDAVYRTSNRILSVFPDTVEALRDRTVLDGRTARTVKLEIQRAGGGFLQLVRRNGGWIVQQPSICRADKMVVESFLDALYAVRVRSFVWDPPVASPADPANPREGPELEGRVEGNRLPADESEARIRVWHVGDDVGRELVLGRRPSPEGTEIVARRRDDMSIFTIDARFLDAVPTGLHALRDHRVFDLEAKSVAAVKIQKGDAKLSIERTRAGGWRITEPVMWKADEEIVGGFVDRLSRLQAIRFLDASPENAEALGLRAPSCTISLASWPPADSAAAVSNAEPGVSSGGGQPSAAAGQTLLIGAPTTNPAVVNAMMLGGSVVFELVADSVKHLDRVPVDPLMFHDRTVLAVPAEMVRMIACRRDGKGQSVVRQDSGGWRAGDGETNAVDEAAVETVLFFMANLRAVSIEKISPPDLAPYGLAQPNASLTLGLSGEDGIRKTLLLGSAAAQGGIYGTVLGQDVVFVLDEGVVFRLTRDLLKPAGASRDAAGAPRGG